MPPAINLNAYPTPPGQGPQRNPLWSELSVNPFQLMRLKVDITEHFKTGDIVSLSDQLMPAYRSPTKYPGQDDENKDSTTSVRIYKWVKSVTANDIETGEGYKIRHAHLVDPLTNKGKADSWRPGAMVKVAVTADGVTYKTVIYPSPSEPDRQAYLIRNGLRGYVSRCVTPSGGKTVSTIQPAAWTYVVQFTIMETVHDWLPCRFAVPVVNLEPLSPAETTAEKKRIMQTKPGTKTRQLVSYTTPTGPQYIA